MIRCLHAVVPLMAQLLGRFSNTLFFARLKAEQPKWNCPAVVDIDPPPPPLNVGVRPRRYKASLLLSQVRVDHEGVHILFVHPSAPPPFISKHGTTGSVRVQRCNPSCCPQDIAVLGDFSLSWLGIFFPTFSHFCVVIVGFII